MSGSDPLWKPVYQYGFAGFAAVLLGVVVWLMTSLMDLQRDTIEVINKNTTAIHEMVAYSERTERKIVTIYEHILKGQGQ